MMRRAISLALFLPLLTGLGQYGTTTVSSLSPSAIQSPYSSTSKPHRVVASSWEQKSRKKDPTTAAATTTKSSTSLGYEIRDCRYHELLDCAHLILEAFPEESEGEYDEEEEVNLLTTEMQYAFPRRASDRASYRMLVAVDDNTDDNNNSNNSNNSTIVGFVDVNYNSRTRRVYNPRRPYIGNLCVANTKRRQGVASSLIEAVEDLVIDQTSSASNTAASTTTATTTKLYVRVEATNSAALDLYEKIGYECIPDNPEDGDSTMLHLSKELVLVS